jgi:tetratricopeptide (TPR) repeat protein
MWDLDSGEVLHTLEGHTERVSAVVVTSDGSRAVSCSDDETLKVWDLESGEVLHTLEGHTDEVTAVAVTPDGSRAVSGSNDGTLKVWDLESGEVLHINPLLVVDDLLEKGVELFDSGEFEEALGSFERIIKQQPDNSEAQVYYLSTLSWMDMNRDLIQSANHVIDNDLVSGENLVSVYLLKGNAMLALGHYEQALDTLDRGLELDDENTELWTIRGKALIEIGNYQQALECFLKTRSLNMRDDVLSEETETYIGLCYLQLDDIVNADLKYSDLIGMGSEHPLTFYGYGMFLVMNNEPDKACKWLLRFLEDPGEELQGFVPQAQQIVDKIC